MISEICKNFLPRKTHYTVFQATISVLHNLQHWCYVYIDLTHNFATALAVVLQSISVCNGSDMCDSLHVTSDVIPSCHTCHNFLQSLALCFTLILITTYHYTHVVHNYINFNEMLQFFIIKIYFQKFNENLHHKILEP